MAVFASYRFFEATIHRTQCCAGLSVYVYHVLSQRIVAKLLVCTGCVCCCAPVLITTCLQSIVATLVCVFYLRSALVVSVQHATDQRQSVLIVPCNKRCSGRRISICMCNQYKSDQYTHRDRDACSLSELALQDLPDGCCEDTALQ